MVQLRYLVGTPSRIFRRAWRNLPDLLLDWPILWIVVVALGVIAAAALSRLWGDLGVNLAAEAFGLLFGVILTVALIDRLQKRREEKRDAQEDRLRYRPLAFALRGWLAHILISDHDFCRQGSIPTLIDQANANGLLEHLDDCQVFGHNNKSLHTKAADSLDAMLGITGVNLGMLATFAPPKRPDLSVLLYQWHVSLNEWRGSRDETHGHWKGCLQIAHFLPTVRVALRLIDYLGEWEQE